MQFEQLRASHSSKIWNLDVPDIENNIPGINRDHDFHWEVSDSQLDIKDQFINESQVLLQIFQGNSILSLQDQLFSLAFSTARCLDGANLDFLIEAVIPTTGTSDDSKEFNHTSVYGINSFQNTSQVIGKS